MQQKIIFHSKKASKTVLLCLCALAISGIFGLLKPCDAYAGVLFSKDNPSNGPKWFDCVDDYDGPAMLFHEKGTNHWTKRNLGDKDKTIHCSKCIDAHKYSVSDGLIFKGKDECADLEISIDNSDDPCRIINDEDFYMDGSEDITVAYSEWINEPGYADYYFELWAYDWDGQVICKFQCKERSHFDGWDWVERTDGLSDFHVVDDPNPKAERNYGYYLKYTWDDNIAYWKLNRVGIDN